MIYVVVRTADGTAHFYNKFLTDAEASREQEKWRQMYRSAGMRVFINKEKEMPCHKLPSSHIKGHRHHT